MPFSDPLCAQYSLSVIKNLSRGNRRFFSCCRTDKRKNLPLQIHYIKRRPVCQYDAPAPFAGDLRPPSRETPVPYSRDPPFARATHSRETTAPRVFFGGARSPSVTRRVRPRDNSDPQARKNRPPSLPKSIPKAPKSPPTSPKSWNCQDMCSRKIP